MVGLKNNQKELFQMVSQAIEELPVKYSFESEEKGHGRTTARHYEVYDIQAIKKAERWTRSKIATLVKVKRQSVVMKTGKQSAETSYYISNQKRRMNELCRAVRGHWQVEVNNHRRDVTFAEDRLRTKKESQSNALAEIRTLACLLLKQHKSVNHKAQSEDFGDDFESLITWLKKLNFL